MRLLLAGRPVTAVSPVRFLSGSNGFGSLTSPDLATLSDRVTTRVSQGLERGFLTAASLKKKLLGAYDLGVRTPWCTFPGDRLAALGAGEEKRLNVAGSAVAGGPGDPEPPGTGQGGHKEHEDLEEPTHHHPAALGHGRGDRTAQALLVAAIVTGLLGAKVAPAGVRADFEPPDTRQFRTFGPFYVRPTLALKDIGRDSNVFLTVDDHRSDFTATVSPSVDGAVRFGTRGFLTLKLGGDYVWFHEFTSLNHANLVTAARGNLNLKSLRFFGAVGYQKHDERPNNELDQRAKRTNQVQRAGIGFEYSPKTAIDSIVSRERITYEDPDFVYQPDSNGDGTLDKSDKTYTLGDLLSRTETTGTLRFTQRVLGRTRLVLDAQKRRYDFLDGLPKKDSNGEYPVVGSVRDASETRFLAGFEVDPGSIVSGTLRAGRINFRPRAELSQETQQAIWSTVLNWRLGPRLSLSTGLDRDLFLSTFADNLYYRQAHRAVQCVYYLNRMLGIETGYDAYELLYPTETQAPGFEGRRRDTIRIVKGGLRFRLANRTTAALRVAERRRTSNVPNSEDSQILVTTGVETSF